MFKNSFKVIEDSSAERNGLKFGDVIIQINDLTVTDLSHQSIFDIINGIQNTMTLHIERKKDSVDYTTPRENLNVDNLAETELTHSLMNTTEETIAEIISGESEVLKGHNVIG